MRDLCKPWFGGPRSLRGVLAAIALIYLSNGASSAAERVGDYLKLTLPHTGSDILDTLYEDSIADALFVKAKHIGFPNQPIEYLVRKKSSNSQTGREILEKEILASLGINVAAPASRQTKKRAFMAGPHRTAQGYVAEFETTDADGRRTTCIAFVDDAEHVYAVYLRFTSAPNCSSQLIQLVRSQRFLS